MSLQKFKENALSAAFGSRAHERKDNGQCVHCGELIFCHPSIMLGPEDGVKLPTEEEKKTKGIVYSRAGYCEVGISGLCEACFDAITDIGE